MKACIRLTAFASISLIFLSAWNGMAGVGGSPSPAVPESGPQISAAIASGEQVKWKVVSGGGSRGSSASYILSGTIGQTAAGVGASASYELSQGFWQDYSSGCMCGDADGNLIFTISDAVYLINYIFAGGPVPCTIQAGDADGNGIITISDAVYLINYIFAGGPAPACPACS